MNWRRCLSFISACGPIVGSWEEARLSNSSQDRDSTAVVLQCLEPLEDSAKSIAPSVVAAARDKRSRGEASHD